MNILLAIDSSTGSQAALDEVAARPWPAESRVEVLSVIEPAHLWSMSITAEVASGRAKELVARAVEQLRGAGLEANGVAMGGDPKTVILNRLAAAHADLVVLGSHGVSALAHYLLGNVASSIVRHARTSVEIVRSPEGSNRPARKILLATDGSDSSKAAAQAVASRPWPKGTEIRVFSVVEFYLPTAMALLEPPFIQDSQLPELREAAMKHTQDAVAQAIQILTPMGVNLSESISVLIESPKTVILDEAREWGADLIVLGSHGRGGMERFLMGSVAETVATHAPCSVEVVRQAS